MQNVDTVEGLKRIFGQTVCQNACVAHLLRYLRYVPAKNQHLGHHPISKNRDGVLVLTMARQSHDHS